MSVTVTSTSAEPYEDRHCCICEGCGEEDHDSPRQTCPECRREFRAEMRAEMEEGE